MYDEKVMAIWGVLTIILIGFTPFLALYLMNLPLWVFWLLMISWFAITMKLGESGV